MAIARDHAEWLSLLDISGPFLSLSVLVDAFPQGLEAHDSAHMAILRQAAREWGETTSPDMAIHQAWIRFVLSQTLGFPDELIAEGQALPPQLAVSVPEYGETLRPDLAILAPPGRPDAGAPCLLIQVLPPGQEIEKALPGRHWNASPATRMVDLLHGSGVRLGLVTNGEQWMLVNAPAARHVRVRLVVHAAVARGAIDAAFLPHLAFHVPLLRRVRPADTLRVT